MGRTAVLIADKLADWCIADLKESGCEVHYQPELKDDALTNAIRDTSCRVLVVRSTKVKAEMLRASVDLALIVRAGAGYNNIDVEEASRRSIMVANCPGKNAIAVAELAMGLMLAVDRRIADNVVDLRSGLWKKKEYAKARGLKGRTLGICGMGEIGKAVMRRAQAFKMNIAGWSRSLTPEVAEQYGIQYCETIGELASVSDVFSIHLAANKATEKIIDQSVIDKLRPGSYVINTSRAEVIDQSALEHAITTKNLRAGLDVFEHEPGASDTEFADNIVNLEGVVYGTHHIGASTDQAQDEIARETVRIITHFVRNGEVCNCVNLREDAPAHYVLVVRHKNKPGVLAHTLNKISHSGINVEEMQNIICAGSDAACAQIVLDGPLDEATQLAIRDGNEHVLAVTISENIDA
ncbi:MAG: NAD(P)-dependent oxidoreductase [Phycisphaerae bacterium]